MPVVPVRFAPVLGLLALLISAPAFAQEVPVELQGSLPAGIQRQREGGGISLGPPVVVAGKFEDAAWLQVNLTNLDGEVGAPNHVSWHMSVTDWCAARDSSVSTVLTDPSGRQWRDGELRVPAGGVHPGEAHRVFGRSEDPDLLALLDTGGRFTLALEDDQGQRINEVAIQIPGPAARRRMHRDNRALLRATDPASVPPRRQDRVEYVAPVVVPGPPRAATPRVPRDCTPN